MNRRLAVTERIAREAGILARTWFDRRNRLQIETKGPQDLVSEADRAVEVLIRERLAAAFPGERVIGEEGGDDGAGHVAEQGPGGGAVGRFGSSIQSTAPSASWPASPAGASRSEWPARAGCSLAWSTIRWSARPSPAARPWARSATAVRSGSTRRPASATAWWRSASRCGVRSTRPWPCSSACCAPAGSTTAPAAARCRSPTSPPAAISATTRTT
ncbi:MAG: hypothetical protein IH900_05895 [Proteobacteria bacterium]|nr:hypothetical protein [Pseudomonadota bacterium]